MNNKTIFFEPNHFFHIYNHGNGDDNIFKNDGNYLYFLNKYAEYLNPISQTYAYCLMPNHFHFLVKIKSNDELIDFFKMTLTSKSKNLQGLEDLEGLISQQYSNFFNAYSKAFNKQQDRRGSLFTVNLKRKRVNNDAYFTQLIHYIHYNPVHHGFVESLDD
jgi:REP element-mobilizing transposase RayT